MPDAEQIASRQARADRLNRSAFAVSLTLLAGLIAFRMLGHAVPAGDWIVPIGLVVIGATGVIRLRHRVTLIVLLLSTVAMLGEFVAVIVRAAR